MHAKPQLVALVGLFLISPSYAKIKSSSVFEKCFTTYTSTSTSSVPTTTSSTSITIPVFRKTTTTLSSTITPPAVTSTATATSTSTKSTTASQITDTYTSTSTLTTTSTSTAPTTTQTSSATTTTTTTTFTPGTTTVAAPSGFMPAVDTIPGASSNKKKRALALGLKPRAGLQLLQPGDSRNAAISKSKYPASVGCYIKTEYFSTTYKKTATAKSTATVTASTPTTIVTTTATVFTTSTVLLGNASTTITVYTTSTAVITTTPSTTVTRTSTSTVSATEPAATAYGACGASNLVGTVDGYGLADAYYFGSLVYTNDTTAAGCCAACFMNPACNNAAWFGAVPVGQQCSVAIESPCAYFGEYNQEVYYSTTVQPNRGVVVSNGICGEFNAAYKQ